MPPRSGLLWPHFEEESSAENLGKRMELIGLIYFPSGTVEFIIRLRPGFSFLPLRCIEL